MVIYTEQVFPTFTYSSSKETGAKESKQNRNRAVDVIGLIRPI